MFLESPFIKYRNWLLWLLLLLRNNFLNLEGSFTLGWGSHPMEMRSVFLVDTALG